MEFSKQIFNTIYEMYNLPAAIETVAERLAFQQPCDVSFGVAPEIDSQYLSDNDSLTRH